MELTCDELKHFLKKLVNIETVDVRNPSGVFWYHGWLLEVEEDAIKIRHDTDQGFKIIPRKDILHIEERKPWRRGFSY